MTVTVELRPAGAVTLTAVCWALARLTVVVDATAQGAGFGLGLALVYRSARALGLLPP